MGKRHKRCCLKRSWTAVHKSSGSDDTKRCRCGRGCRSKIFPPVRLTGGRGTTTPGGTKKMARNSYDMDDNMKNSGSETYDKTKNQSRNSQNRSENNSQNRSKNSSKDYGQWEKLQKIKKMRRSDCAGSCVERLRGRTVRSDKNGGGATPAAIFAVIADERYMISDVMRTQNGSRQLHKALKCAGIDCAERNHVRAARHILN